MPTRKKQENQAVIYPCYFPEIAEKYMDIFNELRITDLLNTPKIKDLPPAWYKDFALSFFGSVDIQKRERLLQEFFVLIPKKNGKSTASGLIMLTALIANPYKGAEFAIIASSKEVIDNCFIPISENIEQNETLKSFLKCTNHADFKQVENLRTGAKLKITTPLMKTNQGKKWQGVLIDEIALWQDFKNGIPLLNEITGNLVNKLDSFVIYLTTQSSARPDGLFKALLTKARAIKNKGEKEIKRTKFLPILYEFSAEQLKDGWQKDPKKWHLVNPSLNVSVSLDRLKQMQKDAEIAGGQAEQEFYAKFLNVEIQTEQDCRAWAGAKYVHQCERAITLDTVLDKAEIIYIGIDGGGLDDLTGLAVLGVSRDKWYIWTKGYCYKSALNRAGLAKKLIQWQKKNEIYISDNIGEDSKILCDDVAYILGSGKVSKIGIDPRGIGEILINLKNIIDNEQIIDFINQGVFLQNASVILSQKIAQKKCEIAKSELFMFCCGNAIIETNTAGDFLTKRTSQAKIDLLMALINCVFLCVKYGDKKTQSTKNASLSNAIRLINALK